MLVKIPIANNSPALFRTQAHIAEISWFVDLMNGDTQFLGQFDPQRRSTFEHCLNIAKTADRGGFDGILLPTSYYPGPEPLTFAAALLQETENIRPIAAIRLGEVYPPTLARMLGNLYHQSGGRLIINAISSDLPGQTESADQRYARTAENLDILKQAFYGEEINFQGNFYNLKLPSLPTKAFVDGMPPVYFGGISDQAIEVAARYADTYLMWPETIPLMSETIAKVSRKAASFGRVLDYGLRIHIIVRETEAEALEYAEYIASKLDEEKAAKERAKHLDSRSLGVFRQDELRKKADKNGFIEPCVWSTVGKAFSGCGSALVGSQEQILEKLEQYMKIGFRSFIFSGFPLLEESEQVSKLILPYIQRGELLHRV